MPHIYLGWVGALLFSISAIPQVIKTIKTKEADDLSVCFLFLWFFGEVCTLIYLLIDDSLLSITHYPLYINYIANIIMISYLLWAKKKYSGNRSTLLDKQSKSQ